MGQAVRLASHDHEDQIDHGELRRTPRRSIDQPARLVLSDLSRSFDLTLCDLSAGGVRVRLPAGEVLPKHSYLMVRDAATDSLLCLPCETRWQVCNAAGLRFLMRADAAWIAAL
jgi:PilZ domain